MLIFLYNTFIAHTASFYYLLFILSCLLNIFLIIFSKNAINSALFFIIFFFLNFCFLMTLGADFLALLFLIIYAGAVSILFIFLIMLLDIRFLLIYNRRSLFNFLILFFLFFIFYVILFVNNNITTFTNVDNLYLDWLNIYMSKPNLNVVGLFLVSNFFFDIVVVSLLLTLVLLVIIFIIVGKRNLYTNHNFITTSLKYRADKLKFVIDKT